MPIMYGQSLFDIILRYHTFYCKMQTLEDVMKIIVVLIAGRHDIIPDAAWLYDNINTSFVD